MYNAMEGGDLGNLQALEAPLAALGRNARVDRGSPRRALAHRHGPPGGSVLGEPGELADLPRPAAPLPARAGSPSHERRQAHQISVRVRIGAEAELGAAVVDQVELHV